MFLQHSAYLEASRSRVLEQPHICLPKLHALHLQCHRNKHTVHVCHSYDDAGNLSKPKTKAGNRILPLPDIAFDALEQLADVLTTFFKSYAPDLLIKDEEGAIVGLSDDAPVISDRLGNRIHPAGLGHWWYNHRAGYGLDGWTLHELRHTFLTLAAEKGVHPSVMQKLAGHSTSRLTMDIYTHVNMDAQRDAMDNLQSVFQAS